MLECFNVSSLQVCILCPVWFQLAGFPLWVAEQLHTLWPLRQPCHLSSMPRKLHGRRAATAVSVLWSVGAGCWALHMHMSDTQARAVTDLIQYLSLVKTLMLFIYWILGRCHPSFSQSGGLRGLSSLQALYVLGLVMFLCRNTGEQASNFSYIEGKHFKGWILWAVQY